MNKTMAAAEAISTTIVLVLLGDEVTEYWAAGQYWMLGVVALGMFVGIGTAQWAIEASGARKRERARP